MQMAKKDQILAGMNKLVNVTENWGKVGEWGGGDTIGERM